MVTFNLQLPQSLWKNTESRYSHARALGPGLESGLYLLFSSFHWSGLVTWLQTNFVELRNVILNSQKALKELWSTWLIFVTIKTFSWFFFSPKDLSYTMRIQMRKHDNITLEWGQLENESEIFCAKHLCFMILKPFPYISCNHDCYSFPHCDSSEFIQ